MNRLLTVPSRLQFLGEKEGVDDFEGEMIEAAKANVEAFGPLYERYVQQVYRYMRTRTRNEDDAADLTQQTFLNALHGLPRYTARGVPFAAWLFRIALYTIRQKQRKERITVSWDLLPEALHPKGDEGPEGVILSNERMVRIEGLLEQLKTSQRELLVLRFAAGLSSAEIAAVLGKKQSAIKKQLSRILHHIKEEYYQNEQI